MYDRKIHVIKTAHELFIDKGYQATSIQDILEYSGISKGTFYNYFSSKGELLIALFKTLYKNLEKERNDILIGQDRSDIQIFIKQIELEMKLNQKNNLLSLFEEAFFSNEADLKKFFNQSLLFELNWCYNRFIDIFGEDKKPILLDCAIMFLGILQHNIRYNSIEKISGVKINQIIRYSVDRLITLVNDVTQTGQQLLNPDILTKWLPGCNTSNQEAKKAFLESSCKLKLQISKTLDDLEQKKYGELIEFIQEELLHANSPRPYLIECTLSSLKGEKSDLYYKELQQFEKMVASYLHHLEQSL